VAHDYASQAARTNALVNHAIDVLKSTPPSFHRANGQEVQWAIGPGTLNWLRHQLPSCKSTLETGCGHTTVVFAAAGVDHVAVTPSEAEVARVSSYCMEHGIPLDRVQFKVGDSSRVLPTMTIPPLDLALIDGAHAFPFPCIDWFFTESALKIGGHVVVDDFRMPSVAILVDFLDSERETWKRICSASNSVIYRKCALTDYSHDWERQRMNRNATVPPLLRRVRLKVKRTARDLSARLSR